MLPPANYYGMNKVIQIVLMVPVAAGAIVATSLVLLLVAMVLDTIVGALTAVARGQFLELHEYQGVVVPLPKLQNIFKVNTWLMALLKVWLYGCAAILVTGLLIIVIGVVQHRFLTH